MVQSNILLFLPGVAEVKGSRTARSSFKQTKIKNSIIASLERALTG
jgi:hypothetical protein